MEQKTIKISKRLHTELKIFCEDRNLKLNKFCEMLIADGFLYAKEYANLDKETKMEKSS